MDAGVSPARAGLGWSIPKVRRAGGERAGGFPGAEAVLAELGRAPTTRRGLRPEGRAPIREGVTLFDAAEGGNEIGTVTSGEATGLLSASSRASVRRITVSVPSISSPRPGSCSAAQD
mgnify:CR=1 FL=1